MRLLNETRVFHYITLLCTCIPYLDFVLKYVHCTPTEAHQWLLGDEVDLLPALLLPLAGPETFEEEEMEGLPPDLQYLPDDKQREVDPGIRKMCLEAVMKVCVYSVAWQLNFEGLKFIEMRYCSDHKVAGVIRPGLHCDR